MSTSVPTTSNSSSRPGHRQTLMPSGTSWKRKDRNAPKVPPLVAQPPATILSPRPTKAPRPEPKSVVQSLPPAKPMPRVQTSNDDTDNNLVLAGYLAHEYLTRGTIMGQGSNPTSAAKNGETEEKSGGIYSDMARLVMGESGVHVPGIVNPTELSSWLQQKQGGGGGAWKKKKKKKKKRLEINLKRWQVMRCGQD